MGACCYNPVQTLSRLAPCSCVTLYSCVVSLHSIAGQGGDGGPLQGVVQEWRGHWAQCWAAMPGAGGLQVGQKLVLCEAAGDRQGHCAGQ